MTLTGVKKWTWICLLTISVAFLTSTTGAIVNKRSGFGEFCNSTSKCNRSAWLTCQDGICACAKIDEMVYNELSSKCVSKTGERCKFEVDDGIYERTDCVSNASCNIDGICACDINYFEVSDGNCLSQGNLGDPCLADVGCKTNKFLKCLNGQCICEPSVSETSLSSEDGCVGLAGKPCLNNKCTNNAACWLDGNCICSDGYFQNDRRKCQAKKSYLDTCTKNSECDSRNALLECWNGSCSCSPNYTTMYTVNRPLSVEIKGTCVSRMATSPGMINSPNYPSQYRNAEDCSWLITSSKNSVIQLTFLSFETEVCCDHVHVYDGSSVIQNLLITANGGNIPGVLKSTGNTMFVRFVSDQSTTGKGFQAKYEQVKTIDECVGLANKPCNRNGNCVSNAVCSNMGQCQCNSEYTVTSTGSCGLSHAKTCDDVDICSDSFACTERKCTCKYPLHQIYKFGDKCVSIVSGPCSDDTDCIQGANCKVNNKSSRGFCECNQGLVENVEGKCEIGHGNKCSFYSDVCDKLAGLQCVNGVCSCPDQSMAFNTRVRKCQGLVHFRCGKTKREQTPCVENAECVVSIEGLSGVCQCRDGFEETPELSCTEIIGATEITAGVEETPESDLVEKETAIHSKA